MTQANDLPARMNRAEDNIIDLRLAASALLQATDKNSEDIAGFIELSRRNLEGIAEFRRATHEGMAELREGMAELRSNTAALQASGLRMEETIRSIQATNERMDRLFDYLIRRDQGTQA